MHSFSSESNVTLSTSIKIFNKLLHLRLTEMRKSSGRQMTHSVGADTVTSLFFKSEQSDIIQYQENCQAFFIPLHCTFCSSHTSLFAQTHITLVSLQGLKFTFIQFLFVCILNPNKSYP